MYHVPAFLINQNFVRENLKDDVVLSAMCENLIIRPGICENFQEVNLYFEEV
jgi:hypothetical protein